MRRLHRAVERLAGWHRTWPRPLRWALPVVWMCVIYVLSAQPTLPSASSALWDVLLKKGGHMAGYAVLTLLIWQALGCRRLGLAWVLAVAYAASDEVHQTFVPGRNGTPVDVVVDAVGALAAAIVVWQGTIRQVERRGPRRAA
jgi:VanZ family protein